MGWGIRSTYSRGLCTFRGGAAGAWSRGSNFARSYRCHLEGCGRVAAHAGFCCCATPVPGNKATPTGAWAWGMLPKFENSFPPVAAPKATPTLWALSAQPNKRGHQATPPQLLRGRRCAQRRNGRVGVAQTSCAAWTRPRKSFNKATPPQVSRERRYKLGSASGVAQTDCIQTLHASSSAQEHPRKEYFAYSDSAAKVLSTTPSFISPTRVGAMLRGLKHCGVSPPAEVGDRHATVSAPPVPLGAFTP